MALLTPLAVVNVAPEFYGRLPRPVRECRFFAKLAVLVNNKVWTYLPAVLRRDVNFAIRCVGFAPTCYDVMEDTLRLHPDVMFAVATHTSPQYFRLIPPVFQREESLLKIYLHIHPRGGFHHLPPDVQQDFALLARLARDMPDVTFISQVDARVKRDKRFQKRMIDANRRSVLHLPIRKGQRRIWERAGSMQARFLLRRVFPEDVVDVVIARYPH